MVQVCVPLTKLKTAPATGFTIEKYKACKISGIAVKNKTVQGGN